MDLDGTLARYEGWKGGSHIGDPIPTMLERVKHWRSQGQEVRIFTARVYDKDVRVLRPIQEWCLKHIGEVLPVTNCKDFGMIELWDDRAVQVVVNTGMRVDGKESQ